MQSKIKTKITALYPRLSRDDYMAGDSNSIINQKKLLADYAKKNGFTNTKLYVDDGFTGTNFNRPGFKALMEDIKAGLVSTIIVKDLSRLGRNYIEVGTYLEDFFPDYNVRFIAISDSVDSDAGYDDSVAFKNIVNEMYARDISKKCKMAFKVRGNEGIPLSQPVFGYTKNPDDKYHWLIDDEAAKVVQKIYAMCIDGKGPESIARSLEKEQILTPSNYWLKKGIKRTGKKGSTVDPYHWNNTSVIKILSAQEYIGDIINFKTYSKSFRKKKRIPTDADQRKVFRGVNPPIIDQKTFELVQSIRHKNSSKKTKSNEKNMFAGLLYCSDCGSKLHYNKNSVSKIEYFTCGNYRSTRQRTCSNTHYVRVDSLEQIVLNEVKMMTSLISKHEKEFVEVLSQRRLLRNESDRRIKEKRISELASRLKELDVLFEKTYEDNAMGKLSDERYLRMSAKYDKEQSDVEAELEHLRNEIDEAEDCDSEQKKFLSSVRKFTGMHTLTPSMLRELIKKIVVYPAEGNGENKHQRIEIYYNFIGAVDIPDVKEKHNSNVRQTTRSGVSITYDVNKLQEAV